MLLALRISSFAVIEEAEVTFGPGLTVLTGETGAGKSILVDALGLLLGGRADADVVRAGCDEATIEGLFASSAHLEARLAELGLPDLGPEVSVRRVIGRAGRAKAYVNGALVTVGVLGRLLRGFVDIAGQHEHMSLFDPALHLDILDRTGSLAPQLARYREVYRALQDVERRIEELGGDERKARERADLLEFQLRELTAVGPQPGEDQALELERRKLASAEKLRRAAGEADNLLSSEDGSALDRVGRAVALLSDAVRLDPGLGEVLSRLTSAKAELEEATFALGRYLASLEGDPKRLLDVDERLDALKRLCRKHGVDLPGLLQRQAELAAELSRWENRQGLLAQLEAERSAAHATAESSAAALSEARVEAASELSELVREGLAHLAMDKAAFEVSVTPSGELGPDGADQVELLFSANPGEPPRPLAKVASGGEASRLLLALRRALAGTDTGGCYVLDEADAGVSGAVAEVVGRMIKEVSRSRQVLCITHLPQVAAFADAHLLIEKDQQRGRTFSRVLTLRGDEERRRELARMLSGLELTEEAMGAADALMRSVHRALQVPAARAKRKATPSGKDASRARRSA